MGVSVAEDLEKAVAHIATISRRARATSKVEDQEVLEDEVGYRESNPNEDEENAGGLASSRVLERDVPASSTGASSSTGQAAEPAPDSVVDGTAALADPAPAPPRREPRVVLEKGPVGREREDRLEADHPKEWHGERMNYQMRDLPTNIIVEGDSKKVLPPGPLTLVIAAVAAMRRKYLQQGNVKVHPKAKSSPGADLYIPHNLQSPLRHSVENWIKENFILNRVSWGHYVELGSDLGQQGDENLETKVREAKRRIFGKEWFFDLFIAFGGVNQEMLNCINDVIMMKAAAEKDKNPITAVDPAPPRVPLNRLSRRNRRKWSSSTPDIVKAVGVIREDAKREERVWQQAAEELLDDVSWTGLVRGGMEQRTVKEWAEADRASTAAASDYKGRDCNWVTFEGKSVVESAIESYLYDVNFPRWLVVMAPEDPTDGC